ncbi:MAG: sodium:proton antiporter [Dehalococcoidia bacterium]
MMWSMLLDNINYAVAMILFCIGFYTVIVRSNIIKQIIGLLVMEVSVFFFLVSVGYLDEGAAPIVIPGDTPSPMVNPLPQAMILTAIVIAVSTTALFLSLALKFYSLYGTLDMDKAKEDKR